MFGISARTLLVPAVHSLCGSLVQEQMKIWLWSFATAVCGILVERQSSEAHLQLSASHLPPFPQPPVQSALPELPTLPQSVFDISPPTVRMMPTLPPNASKVPPATKQREACLPPELECFWMQEPSAERSDERLQERELKVWEKPTCSSSYAAISKISESELPMAPLPRAAKEMLAATKRKVMEEEQPDNTFLTTMATKPAIGLVETLRKSEKDVRTYVQKKREVFLVHMACDNKREEIVRLDAMAKAKEDALTIPQQILDEDTKKFEEYLQERIAKASSSTKDSEMHAKVKQDKLGRIKSLRQQIATVQSETSKLKEVRVECEKYKMFLEKITPAEWKEEQKRKKEQRKKERAERWKKERLAPFMEYLAHEEQKLFEKFAQEDAEAEASKKRGRKQRRREDEEEFQQRQRERDSRRKRLQKRKEEEERKVDAEYVAISSEEEPELFFKEPQQLMDSFTDLEELNLFLIQSSQEAEQQLDEIRNSFEAMQKNMGHKVQQLKDQIKQLDQSIKQEQRRGEEIKQRHAEKASTATQDKKLSSLAKKVHEVYARCNLARDQQQSDTLQMLGAIESRIEELIQGLDEAYQQDEELVMRLEKIKESDRRERVRESRLKEQPEKQEFRLKQSLQRAQKPIFKKAGKQLMYRSPPLRQEHKVVEDNSDDEAHARDHEVFDIYIDRKTGVPNTTAPSEETRPGSASHRVRTTSHQKTPRDAAAPKSARLPSNRVVEKKLHACTGMPQHALDVKMKWTLALLAVAWPSAAQSPFGNGQRFAPGNVGAAPGGFGQIPGVSAPGLLTTLGRQPGSVDSGFARPAVEPFQQPVFAQMVDPARPSPNTKDWPQNVAYGSYPGPTGLPPNGPHANWQVDQRVPEHGQHAQGSGGEGMQVFHAAVQLMQKGQLMEAKKALTAAVHVLGTSRDILPVAAQLRHRMGLPEVSAEQVEVWLEWRTEERSTIGWKVLLLLSGILSVLVLVYRDRAQKGLGTILVRSGLSQQGQTEPEPEQRRPVLEPRFMPADACIGDDAGQRNKIDRHEQTDAYAVPSDSVAVLAGPKEEASQNEIFDSVPNDLREPEAEEHVEEYSMADCEDVATETLHEGDHIDRRPFVKELEQDGRAKEFLSDGLQPSAIVSAEALPNHAAVDVTDLDSSALQASHQRTEAGERRNPEAFPDSQHAQPQKAKRQVWRSRAKKAEDDRLVEAGMLDDVVEASKPAFATVGHSTDGHKDKVTSGKTEHTNAASKLPPKAEDWGWGAGHPQAASDGCIYFAGGPPPGRQIQPTAQAPAKTGRRWQAGGRASSVPDTSVEEELLELDVKLEQDGNFFLAKPTRFRPQGCFLRLQGGREAFLPVEHITPHADASTNGVRSIVTQSSKGGRLRVREIGAGRVSMLTPNEEALRCKELEARRRNMEEKIEQLRENYNPAKWIIGFVSAVQPNGVYVSVIDGQDARIPLKELPEKFLMPAEDGSGEAKPTLEIGQAVQFRLVRYSWGSESFAASMLPVVERQQRTRERDRPTDFEAERPPSPDRSAGAKAWAAKGYSVVTHEAAVELNGWIRSRIEEKKSTKGSKALIKTSNKTYLVSVVRGMNTKAVGSIDVEKNVSDKEVKQAAVDLLFKQSLLKAGEQHKGIVITKNIISIKL
ncbi:FAP100 [Symbiodinium microadriaticum]|nr:FAP100 [Symbiodinium microadriaticum]